jgi:hypothetical protein
MVRTPLLKLGLETQIVRSIERTIDPGVQFLPVPRSNVRDGKRFEGWRIALSIIIGGLRDLGLVRGDCIMRHLK